jgi:hypothetical protein
VRVLLLAHGDGWRWNDPDGVPHLGVPKQLITLEGEVLLHRTVRQLLAAGAEVFVVAPDDRFAVEGAQRVSIVPWVTGCDQDKFIATRGLWSAGRTIIMWGDCFYTDEAVAAITGYGEPGLMYFRRTGPSEVTGCEWDESFAVSFTAEAQARVLAAAWQVAFWWKAGRLHTTHIRTHYAATLGFPVDHLDRVDLLVDTPGQTVIDDWTDDIDSPEEFERWTSRRALR